MTDPRRRWVHSTGPRLATYEQGDPNAPTVVLVHGYPDNATIWDGVAELLEPRFHVVRFDLRGHGESDAPVTADGYRMAHLVDDLIAVVTATSPAAPVHLVAHDWGSILSWPAVTDHPDRFASFTTISGPSLDHVGAWMRQRGHAGKTARQLASSWYMAAFQVPGIPELVWRARPLRRRFHASYRDASNGVQLYRANMLNPGRPRPRSTDVPVLQIALSRDRYCRLDLLEAADPWCVGGLWRRPLVAPHWAPRAKPAAVARLVTEFIDHLDGRPAGRELARAKVGGDRRASGDDRENGDDRASGDDQTSGDHRAFTGRLVLVTGAGSGIGRASALAFAKAGADVLCVDIDVETAQRTAEAVAAHGSAGLAFRLDVADGAATRTLAEQVIAEHGVPDIVMANAGIGVQGSFLDTTEEDWQRVLAVNLWGVVHTLRSFLPAMVDRGEGGHIVITASMAGYFATPGLPAYSTTKAGVLMLAQCLQGELREAGIGVSAICPGIVHTNITATARFAGTTAAEQAQRRERATRAYRRRGYGPEKVAAAVVKAVRTNQLVAPVTPEATLTAVTNRVSPALTRALGRWIDRQAERMTRPRGD